MLLSEKIIKKLIKKNISISVAESFTGGLLTSEIISLPGSSKIFNMGLITYSNESKLKILNIKNNTLNKYGAVSKQIANQMVNNLYKLSKSKICISTTGIAGPSGGSKKKPVGLTFIGIKIMNKTIIFEKKFKGSRIIIQKKAVKFIFQYLQKLI